jgi:hypothetical protein
MYLYLPIYIQKVDTHNTHTHTHTHTYVYINTHAKLMKNLLPPMYSKYLILMGGVRAMCC